MTQITANQVADFILCFAREHGDNLTNLKLQKLVYYAQAWHLALYDEPLFDDPVQAWVHGPVVYSVYQRFKDYGWQPITAPIDCDRVTLPEAVEQHLIEVMDEYGGFNAYELERMTHEEAPWQNARGALPMDEPSNTVINPDDMKHYYRQRVA